MTHAKIQKHHDDMKHTHGMTALNMLEFIDGCPACASEYQEVKNRSLYRLTTLHAMSSYGVPVLVDGYNNAYGINDITPDHNGLRVWQVIRSMYESGDISLIDMIRAVPALGGSDTNSLIQ
jgi:hypothetical protein